MIFIRPLIILDLEGCNFNLDITEKGHYSIAILGGHFVRNAKLVDVEARMGNREIVVKKNLIFATYFWEWKRVVDCWGYNMNDTGTVNFKIQNMDRITVKKSRLYSKRMFEPIIDNSKLSIIIFRSDPKIVQFFSILIFILSILALLYSLIDMTV